MPKTKSPNGGNGKGKGKGGRPGANGDRKRPRKGRILKINGEDVDVGGYQGKASDYNPNFKKKQREDKE